jgi:citrate synthase
MTGTGEAKLQQILRASLGLPSDADVTQASQDSVENWDSLGHVSLMLGIESEFGIDIDVADQLGLTSYGAIRAYLEGRGAC